MSESNLLATLGSQPIWLQVFIGLVLFFIGLPLLVLLVSTVLGMIGELLGGLKAELSVDKKIETPLKQDRAEEISDEELFQALSRINPRDDVKSFLKSKTRQQKRALKQNRKVLEALEKLRNESNDTTSACGRN